LLFLVFMGGKKKGERGAAKVHSLIGEEGETLKKKGRKVEFYQGRKKKKEKRACFPVDAGERQAEKESRETIRLCSRGGKRRGRGRRRC